MFGKIKVVKLDPFTLENEDITLLQKYCDLEIYNDFTTKEKFISRALHAEIIIIKWFNITKDILYYCSKLKYIALAASGYHDRVDIEALKNKGIKMSICPHYATESTAEHTINLILNCARFTTQLYQNSNGNFNHQGKELKGKTLGVIGYGKIGKRVADIATLGFGMKIKYINSRSSSSDFRELLKQSDIISINTPLTEKTKNLISYNEFQLMKKNVILVNTARGGVINEDALVHNIINGKIFSVGLDTTVNEPIDKNNILLQFKNVILTPHIGWNTEEASKELSYTTTQNVLSFIKGIPNNIII